MASVQPVGRVYNGEAILVSQAVISDAAAPALPRGEPEAPAQHRAPPVPSLCEVGPVRGVNALLAVFFVVALLGASLMRRTYAAT